MSDKMLRIAGRSKTTGLAKAVTVSENGAVNVKAADCGYKVIMSGFEVAAGTDTTQRILEPIDGDLLGFNISTNVQTTYTVSLQWRLGGVTGGTGVVESENFTINSTRPVFIPVAVLKSAHLTLNIRNTGTTNAQFSIQEVYGKRTKDVVGKVKVDGSPVYFDSYEKDKDGHNVLRVSDVKKPSKLDEQVIFDNVAAKRLTDTVELISNPISVAERDDFDIYVLNANFVPIEVKVIVNLSGDDMLIGYFDWNSESWTVHGNNASFPGVKIPHAKGLVRALSTHPDMYWLKELKASSIKIGVRALEQPPEGYVQFWIGGRKNVQ